MGGGLTGTGQSGGNFKKRYRGGGRITQDNRKIHQSACPKGHNAIFPFRDQKVDLENRGVFPAVSIVDNSQLVYHFVWSYILLSTGRSVVVFMGRVLWSVRLPSGLPIAESLCKPLKTLGPWGLNPEFRPP